MTIQRQYSLPNCTLVVEGLGDLLPFSSEPRPPISTLINVECRLLGEEKPLSGGREFLDSLIKAVNLYTQELLSGLHSNRGNKDLGQQVQFQRVSDTVHRLSIRPEGVDGATGHSEPREITLNTVQLFDLVEAIDQLLADGQTLPELALNLKPVSRREIAKHEPMVERVVPAALGISGLAAAAVLLSMLPVPKVETPKDLYPVRSATTSPLNQTPSPSLSPPGETSPSPSARSSGDASENASPKPSVSPKGEGLSSTPANSSSTASPEVNLKKLETTLTTAAEITNGEDLETLGKQLRDQLEKNWAPNVALPKDLTYRVGVSRAGAILGYKPVGQDSLENARKTPLLELIARQGDRPQNEPLAQFKVLFTASGGVEVAPWRDVMVSPVSGITEITDLAQLEAILPKLRSKINQNWTGRPNFTEDLIFKVRVKQDAEIVDYNPENDAAARYAQDTPLAKLGKPIVDGNTASNSDPLALYKVVFKAPQGGVEISPWRGWSH
jgi:hypothetical protein